jgi:hypothetical protein
MKKQERSKHQIENNNTKDDLANNRVSQCDEDCQKRGKRNLVILCLVFIMLFVAGYFINPSILRIVWLILSGTLAVISGLFLFMTQVRIISIKY